MKQIHSATYRYRALALRADACRVAGRYAESERYYRQALARTEEILGPDHVVASTILNNLGVLYKSMARFDEAEAAYRRAFAIMQTILEPDDPEMATMYHNLGGLEHARGRHAAGEPFARR